MKEGQFLIRTGLLLIAAALRYPVESATLFEWNDALNYLTGSCSEQAADEARNKLVSLLQG